MTSASSSERRWRSLAVYQVPPPPNGWEGGDLVRIVDALGIGAAWLDARRFGSVVALHLRRDSGDRWTTVHCPDGQSIVDIGRGVAQSAMRLRDPVSASFGACDSSQASHVSFHEGVLTVEASLEISPCVSLATNVDMLESPAGTGRRLRISLGDPIDDWEGGLITGVP